MVLLTTIDAAATDATREAIGIFILLQMAVADNGLGGVGGRLFS
jgi:hypothetical protein